MVDIAIGFCRIRAHGPSMAAWGQPEKICHRDNTAGLPLTAEMTEGNITGQCEVPTFAVHSMTIIPNKVLSDHASNGNPTYWFS